MGKNKKVKKVKKARATNNNLLDDDSEYDKAFGPHAGKQPDRRGFNSSLMNAGQSIGHSSIGGRPPPHEPSHQAPQDNLDALPDLDLDAESNVMPGDLGADWDYKDSDHAKVESIVTNNDPKRKTFDINNLDVDKDDDLL